MRPYPVLLLFCVILLAACGQPRANIASETPTATAPIALSPADMQSFTFDQPLLNMRHPAPTAAPTPTNTLPEPTAPLTITIETIDMEQPLIPVGLDEDNVPIVPRHNVGWYIYSAKPGMGENIVLWGHVLRFRDAPDIPAPFARLHEVTIGDMISVTTADGYIYDYTVAEQIWATPDQVEYILPQGTELLTLVSCIGDKVIVDGAVTNMSHRLITIATPIL